MTHLNQQIARLLSEIRHAQARGDEQQACALEIVLEELEGQLFRFEALRQAEQIIDSHRRGL